jgi:hypothetical protein
MSELTLLGKATAPKIRLQKKFYMFRVYMKEKWADNLHMAHGYDIYIPG